MTADVFCWQADATVGSTRTAYRNTAGMRQLLADSPCLPPKIIEKNFKIKP